MERDLDLSDAANLLGVSQKTVERWLRQGVIPTHRQSGRPVFRRVELLQWAREHRLGCVVSSGDADRDSGSNLAHALELGGVVCDLPGANVDEVLSHVVRQAPLGKDVDRTVLLQHLLDRESIVSTGIGGGVALPHPHNPAGLGIRISRVCCFYLKAPIDYGALDGQMVTCLFLILAVDTKTHLRVMSQLAHALSNSAFRAKLQVQASLKELLTTL